ncbi:hypothetical protein KDW_41160 [Dictyobacter vulcani]|uniref:Lipoprotein n=1 Tax=Dictyobacter vulcani TaxID=2607529 RepID=A0A5J4KKN3_9CHLR|nr:hypothetical protein [Dictyobacter vulcani]GER89954.1 hypothetical protein KDW_41160 [Dictyobacter vulcani]
MKTLRRSGPFAFMMLLAILLSACGGMGNQAPTTPTTNTNNGYKTAATPTTAAQMDTMQGIAITMNTTGNMAAFIHTGTATLNGNKMPVLLTNKGFAVYTYKDDPALKATCTGDCAKDWPPVLAAKGMMTISSSMALPKQLSVHQTANGAQVFYDGHALYTYAEDKQPGQAMGNGQDMKWYLVAVPTNATANTPAATTAMMQGIKTTPDMAGNMNAFIHTGNAAINGNQVHVLLNNKNFALYYYKADPALQATCTGACAKDWPPVLAPQGMMTISSSMALPKQLSVHQTANGAQVFYDGHALYTYAEDTQPANAQGRGQDMQWYMVGFLL